MSLKKGNPRSKQQQKKKDTSPVFKFNVAYRVAGSLLMIFVLGLLAVGAVAAGTGIGYFAYLSSTVDVPSKEELSHKINDIELISRMKYSSGEDIAVIKSDLVRTSVKSEEISPLLKQAVISTEDEHFYEHNGIVPKAILRALVSDVTGVGGSSGGSTLTQQLIKQQVLTSETSYKRKATEILLAMKTNQLFSKEEILVAYLNVSPFGRNNKGENIAGVEEAALGLFGKRANDLTLPQAAFIAGLPQSPIVYTPYTHTGEMKEDISSGMARKDEVLFNLYRDKQISKKEYDEAVNYNLKADFLAPAQSTQNTNNFLYNYIYDEAGEIMMNVMKVYEGDNITAEEIAADKKLYLRYLNLAKKEIATRGYTVETTIDKNIYNAMQEAVAQYGDILGGYNGKLVETGSVLMDNKTGRIYGFIGGRDYQKSQNNHAFQTRRSPASTMKPILGYAPAIDIGLIGSETMLADFPRTYKADPSKAVKNYDNTGTSTFKSVRESLKNSYNIPVVNLYDVLREQGVAKEYFDKMNINLTDGEYQHESLIVGGTDYGLTVLEQTGAFATLANGGVYNKGYSITKITDKDGNVVYEHKEDPVRVFKPATASIMNDMMRDVLQSGTGTAAKNTLYSVDNNLANADWVGKTGTSEEYKDYWFTASTPAITMSSWIGYDDGTILSTSAGHSNMVYWAYVTNYVYQRAPEIFGVDQRFELDESVIKSTVSTFTGERPGKVQMPENYTKDLSGDKTTTSYYAVDGAPQSSYRFGIGGTDADYKTVWAKYSPPVQRKKKADKRPENNEDKDKKDD